jgi:hypothetical protein
MPRTTLLCLILWAVLKPLKMRPTECDNATAHWGPESGKGAEWCCGWSRTELLTVWFIFRVHDTDSLVISVSAGNLSSGSFMERPLLLTSSRQALSEIETQHEVHAAVAVSLRKQCKPAISSLHVIRPARCDCHLFPLAGMCLMALVSLFSLNNVM